MGYTHYFAYDPNAQSFVAAWPQMVSDAQRITSHVQETLAIRLADGMGEGAPEISERRIWLNGPAAGDLGHETFVIDPAPWRIWNEQAALGHEDWAEYERAQFKARGFLTGFCKTARKPYDIAVTSTLLRCRHLAPDAFVIGSDGDWQREWQHGATHWDAGCEKDHAPVSLVDALFAQVETPGRSRLLCDVYALLPCSQPATSRATQT